MTFASFATLVGYATLIAAALVVLHYPVRFVSLTLFYMVAYARAGFWRALPGIPAMCWRDNDLTHGLVEVRTLNMTWCSAFKWKFHNRH